MGDASHVREHVPGITSRAKEPVIHPPMTSATSTVEVNARTTNIRLRGAGRRR